jgi:hypothetical protein
VGERHGITTEHRTLDPEYRAERQRAFLDGNSGDSVNEVVEEDMTVEERAAAYVNGELDQSDENTPVGIADPAADPREWPTLIDAAEIVAEMSDDAARPEFVKNPDNAKQVEDR